MSTVFESEEQRREAIEQESWISWCCWTLWFCGAMYLLIGFVMAGFMIFGAAASQSSESVVMILLAFFTLGMCAVFGGANFVAAFGLRQGRKWGWITGVVLGAMYAPSGCLPFGVILLYGLLQDRVRKLYPV